MVKFGNSVDFVARWVPFVNQFQHFVLLFQSDSCTKPLLVLQNPFDFHSNLFFRQYVFANSDLSEISGSYLFAHYLELGADHFVKAQSRRHGDVFNR